MTDGLGRVARIVVLAFLDELIDRLEAGYPVRIEHLGDFQFFRRNGYYKLGPYGQEWDIPEHAEIYFRFNKELRNIVRGDVDPWPYPTEKYTQRIRKINDNRF